MGNETKPLWEMRDSSLNGNGKGDSTLMGKWYERLRLDGKWDSSLTGNRKTGSTLMGNEKGGLRCLRWIKFLSLSHVSDVSDRYSGIKASSYTQVH